MALRVLHVIPSLADCRGGPGVAAIEMVAALNQNGVSAEIATTNDCCEQLLDVELNRLVDYRHVPVRFFARVSTPIKALREFQFSLSFSLWLMRNIQNYDVLHVHALFSYCSSFAMWLARRKGVAYVAHPIGHLERWPLQQGNRKKRWYLRIIEANNIRGASAVHFTAESEQAQALELFPDLQSAVIPLGIHAPMQVRNAAVKLRQRYKLVQGIPILVFLSRIHPKKGLELLLQSIASLDVDTRPQLLIAGDGDQAYLQQLTEMVSELGLDKIYFVGFVQGTEKNLLLQGADIFALTSYSENFGIVVLEALAAGLPVLLCKPVALSTNVAQAKLGYVADTNVDSISDALRLALDDLENEISYSERTKDFVAQHHQWPAIGRQLRALYEELSSHKKIKGTDALR